MEKKTTIKDIASKLGLSASTVSRALSGMPGVDPLTREAVEDLAKELAYSPNLTASRQVRKQSKIIGVIIPSFTIYFYSEALSGMHEAATKRGYHLMICQTSESFDEEKKCLDLLLSSRMDGLIASISRETTDFQHLEKVLQRGLPVVLFNRVCDIAASQVIVDDFQGGYNATQHLLDQAAERVAHIAGPEGLEISKRRQEGYKAAIEETGQSVDDSLVIASDFTVKSGYEGARLLFARKDPPDAIFCVCDAVAYGVMEFAREHQVDIPQRVKVVGFTDEPHARRMYPPLTTIHQPVFDIGFEAATILIDQLENPTSGAQQRVMPSDLRVRASSTPNN